MDSLSQQVIENLPLGIAVYDRNLRCEMWNHFMEEITGISSKKMIGQYPLADFPFLHQIGDKTQLRQFLNGKQNGRGEVSYTSPITGQTLWLSGQYAPLRDASGRMTRLIVKIRDITETKRAEMELRENQRRLTEAQHIGHMGSWERNLVTGDLTWSDQAYKIFEMDRQSPTPSYEQFEGMVHPEDREKIRQARAESFARNIPFDVAFRLPLRDGRIKWVRAHGTTTEYSADGTPVRSLGTIQDVTEQTLTEQELRENQQRLLEAQRIGHMGSWERNLVTGDLIWSDQTYKIFEIDPHTSTPSYKQLLSIVHPEDRERVQQVSAEAAARNVPYELTYRLSMSDGRTKWVQVYGTSAYNVAGVPLRTRGTVQDITAQKLAEQELRENQRRLLEAQRIGRMGSWERDLTTNEFIWSDQAYQLLEMDPRRGEPEYETYLNMIHDDDRELMKRTFREALERKIPYELRYRLKMSDGRIKWVQVYSTTEYSAEGVPLRTRGTIQDITEIVLAEQSVKESELRFAGIISSAMDAIITVDAKQNILLFNNAAERIFGYTAAEIIGQPLARLIPARFHATHRQHLENFELTGIPARSMGEFGPISGVRANGEEFPIEASISQLDVGGRKNYTVILHDITERKLAEQRIAASLQEKETLLREVHHRVKNNLQIISSLFHFQAKKARTPQEMEGFREGQDRLRAMVLVHEQLYRSTDLHSINLGDYLGALSGQLQRSFSNGTGDIHIRFESEKVLVPVEIALPCGMIVTELVANAFKYAYPSGQGGEIRIRIAREEQGFTLSVADSGAGLPPDFDLAQAESFGLKLVSSLADQLGATLTRAPGEGTAINLRVP